MPKEVTFINGKSYDIFCSKCQRKSKCKVYRQRIRWVCRRPCCGEMKHLGYTAPPDELERMGLLDREKSYDTSKSHIKKERTNEINYERQERIKYEMKMEGFGGRKSFF